MAVALPLAGVVVPAASRVEAAAPHYDASAREGSLYRLYRAYFLREPDPNGFAHWYLANLTGMPIGQVSDHFAGSAEFIDRYGSLDHAAFVDLVYRNVLGRPADRAGRDETVLARRGSIGEDAAMAETSEDPPLILLLSGPNLNLLGQREPEVYGTDTLGDLVSVASTAAAVHGFGIEHLQTNHEGVLVDAIHAARGRCAAIVINPGAFTHYAWSIHDALATFDGPIVEVHISNPNAREPWRHTSVVSPVASSTIAGFGSDGYRLAIDALPRLLVRQRP